MDLKLLALMCLTFCFVPGTVGQGYNGKQRLRSGTSNQLLTELSFEVKCECDNRGKQINQQDGDWCWLKKSPCRLLTGDKAPSDYEWVRCVHNGTTQINCPVNCNADFYDDIGFTCKEYIDYEYCTPNGGYGENWKDSWGPISDHAMNGNDAFVCPECGCGGDSRSDEVPRCHSSECWCISAGGNTCGNVNSCDPDSCYNREECPGNGYWCIDGFEQKFLDLEDKMDTLDGKVKWLKNNDDAIKEWAKKTFALKGQ